MVRLSNTQLDADTFAKTNTSEMLKFFGVIILTTKFKFTSRRSLWNTVATSKYRPAPHFGQTGMSRNRFEELFECVRWSHQPPQQGAECSETYRWKLVDDFVTNFNDHRADHFSPSDRICVDESMSRWYGQGGHWINHGLPQYIVIDRKPENGCEIQNAACGESGVMLRLKLVKGVDLVNDEDDGVPTETSLLHGTNVLLNVVSPWFGSHRIVCADSYFASVGAANELYKHGLRFIGVVKTATKGFPKSYLSGVELERRGDFRALTTAMPANVGDPQLASFVWMDRERRYFIATAGSLQAGTPYTRCRWRQVSDEPNAPPQKVNLVVSQPQIVEIYYSTCSAIDKHNRLRQDDLRIEKKVETVNWSTRVNLSIFAMIVVDSWLVYNAFTQGRALNQKEFYSVLAEELFDNDYNNRGQPSSAARRSFQQEACIKAVESGSPKSGVLAHLTPIKRFKNNINGQPTTFRYQGRCKECQTKTTWQCSDCEENGKTVFLCSTKNGKRCFVEHLARNHTHLQNHEP
ncbi:Transposase IS4 [Fragilaria crotonensis]|nr:Transposase IS4 [Fragilaria crotonensis]